MFIFKNNKRITLQNAIQYILEYIKFNSSVITIVCHFSSVDLTTFSDFEKWKTKLANVRKCFTTMIPFKLSYYDKNNHRKTYTINIRDTMLLAPTGKSLAELGVALKLPKMILPDGFDKTQMDYFLQNDKFNFTKYALNDSFITLKWASEMYGVNQKMDITLGGSAAKIAYTKIKEYLKCKNQKEFNKLWLGLDSITEVGDNNKSITSYTDNHNAGPLKQLAMQCFHGGRNECFSVGV